MTAQPNTARTRLIELMLASMNTTREDAGMPKLQGREYNLAWGALDRALDTYEQAEHDSEERLLTETSMEKTERGYEPLIRPIQVVLDGYKRVMNARKVRKAALISRCHGFKDGLTYGRQEAMQVLRQHGVIKARPDPMAADVRQEVAEPARAAGKQANAGMHYSSMVAIVGDARNLAIKDRDYFADKPMEERVALIALEMAMNKRKP